jgi:hypothetical protein
MDIFHRISLNSNKHKDLFEKIKRHEITYMTSPIPGGANLVSFDIKESDPNWEFIKKEISLQTVVNVVETFFSEEECEKADWLRLVPSYEYGYPEPKSQWPVKQKTHDLLCAKCAITRQIGSFRISKEPKLKDNSFMALIACGEIFATREVFNEFRKNSFLGYEAWDVLIHKTGLPSSTIKQIYVPNIVDPGLVEDENTEYTTCEKCSTKKYLPHMRGVMRIQKSAIPHQTDFALSNEWFGSGFIAYRELLISNRVGKLILNSKWKGGRLKPVEVV